MQMIPQDFDVYHGNSSSRFSPQAFDSFEHCFDFQLSDNHQGTKKIKFSLVPMARLLM